MTSDFLNSREKQDGPYSRKLAIRIFGFFYTKQEGNTKSPLTQGKKVLFARKLTIGVYSSIDFQPIKTWCTALLWCYLWCPPLTSLRVDISILGNKWNRGRLHAGYFWSLCMLTYNTNRQPFLRDERKTADQEMGTIKLKKHYKVDHLSTATVYEGQRIGLFVQEAQTHFLLRGACYTSIKLSPSYSYTYRL